MVSNGINAYDPGVPTSPLTGWEQIAEVNCREMAQKIPKVTHGENHALALSDNINVAGLLYTYLAEGVGNKSVGGAFRALKCRFNHWASGRIDHLYVNYTHPKYCHVKCDMTPSMKNGLYSVYILLIKDGDLAGGIAKATCDCAAGLSARLTHVSALLHALVSLCIEYFTASSTSQADTIDEEPNLPVTSYLCQWKAPQKRKESAQKTSESTFEKHIYGRLRKYERKPLEDFDPRPQEYIGKIKERLPALLDRVRGKGLGISLLFDTSICYWDTDATPYSYELPTLQKVKEKCKLFKSTLKLSPERIREIEHKTKDQQLCELWYFARRYRLTASNLALSITDVQQLHQMLLFFAC